MPHLRPPRPAFSQQIAVGLERGLKAFVEDRSIPVDTRQAVAFLSRPPWKGRIAVTPAGWLTSQLVGGLAAADGVRLVGIVDRNPALVADGLPAQLSLPVVAPGDWKALDCDRIVVLHARRLTEITEALRAVGVPDERILRPLADPAYRLAVSNELERSLADRVAALGGRRPVLVLQSSTRRIVPDSVLATLSGSGDVVAVALMEEALESDAPYPTLCAFGAINLLERIVTRLLPQTVYLRTGLDSHLLFPLLRRWVPDCRIVAEPYDFWSLLGRSGEDFAHATVARPHELVGHRLAEQQILADADLIVGKRIGPGWAAFIAPFRRPCVSYHAGISETVLPGEPGGPSLRPSTGTRIRIADTTVLEPPSIQTANAATGDGYDNLGEFRRLSSRYPVEFGVFNLLHRGPKDDVIFRRYLADYSAAPITYHRRVPLEELPLALASYDYGWLNFGRQIEAPDLDMVLPNRFCGYIGAGLPVIVSDRLGRVAALVEEYGAGLVVPAGMGDDLPVSGLEPQRHRCGALALRKVLLATNRRALSEIAALFAVPVGAAKENGNG
jgi:hypothetical protein